MVEIIKATAIQTNEYKQRRQWISGFSEGYETKRVWRVQIQIGRSTYFTSNKTYKSRETAQRAAARLEGKS